MLSPMWLRCALARRAWHRSPPAELLDAPMILLNPPRELPVLQPGQCAHAQLAGRPVVRAAVCGDHPEHANRPIARQQFPLTAACVHLNSSISLCRGLAHRLVRLCRFGGWRRRGLVGLRRRSFSDPTAVPRPVAVPQDAPRTPTPLPSAFTAWKSGLCRPLFMKNRLSARTGRTRRGEQR